MNIMTVVVVALRSISRRPIRSSLTALGVVVGVAAVIVTSSIGNGAQAKLQENLATPGARVVYLSAVPKRSPTRRTVMGEKLAPQDALQPEDYYAIRSSVRDIAAVSPRIYVRMVRARANSNNVDVAVDGVDVDGFITLERALLAGEIFVRSDVARAVNVCVVSAALARSLFGGQFRQGLTLQLASVTFRVVGIVDDDPSLLTGVVEEDLHVYIPFTTLLRRMDKRAQMSIDVQATSMERVLFVQQSLGDIMEERRKGRRADFRTLNAFDSLRSYAAGTRVVSRFLAAIATLSLVVGGIGIMNIMLVSVTERTREIGVRIALGTRRRDILAQFLAEAVTLSLTGGVAGVTLGWVASTMVTRLNDWPTAVTGTSILSAFLYCLFVGALFGYHPARQASLLKPVEAFTLEH